MLRNRAIQRCEPSIQQKIREIVDTFWFTVFARLLSYVLHFSDRALNFADRVRLVSCSSCQLRDPGFIFFREVVAIKRAQEGSVQGEKEFVTEISLLSRLHHHNLLSLIGYCDEEGEQKQEKRTNPSLVDFYFRTHLKKD